MHKTALTIAVLATFAATPDLACGMMQRTATTGTTSGQMMASGGMPGGMMCGRPMAAQAGPGTSPPGQSPMPSAGGCSCCGGMATMHHPPAAPGTPPATPAP